MSREVIASNIPSHLKLSEIAKEFEIFGDVVRTAMDERNRRYSSSMNVYIMFAETVGAKRAVNSKFVQINGYKVYIEENNNRRRSTGNFDIIREVKEIKSRKRRKSRDSKEERRHKRKQKED